MAQGRGAVVSVVLLGLGLALAVIVPVLVVSRHRVGCGPQAFAHAAVAADSKICSDIGRRPVDRGPRGAPWLRGGPPPPRPPAMGAAVHAHHRAAPRGPPRAPRPQPLPAQQPPASFPVRIVPELFFNGTDPLRPQDPLQWPALAATLETVAAEGAEALYTGRLGRMLLEDIAKEGSQLTAQDLASFRPEVVDALALPLGDYTLYSPPPPAGGALLSLVLNVLKGFNFSAESVARPEGSVNLYHHLVETLKFAGGQRWRLWDPRSHPEVQNTSQDLLGEALAQHIRQQIDARGDHQPSHYSLTGTWSHRMGTAHVSVLGEDGSAVAATSTINTPFGAMVYSPRTGILLNNELLDLCWRHPRGSGAAPPPGEHGAPRERRAGGQDGTRGQGAALGGAPAWKQGCTDTLWPPVPGERPPSSMVPSVLVSAAQGSTLVIGGAGGELIVPAVAQAIVNKLWLGFDLQAAIAAPILHVDSKGRVEYEPSFSQEVQKGLQERGQSQTERPFFLNVVQAVSQDGACVYAAADPRKGGEPSGY
ncbi:glutathione hydrolase 5 proenzyme isoform X4 [Hippopotamus amphibius kiboko]|uniref:glutathione hydrolase 5 proenzyme isoform X4 n=1 Tax=Hippopotamus amphibius kiboko TaxID=575201 RepID=UPI002596AC84|nr:glutathione hydrolase 5 proenzyme isoform X4 [Hippopotamus amphibius kiboko]